MVRALGVMAFISPTVRHVTGTNFLCELTKICAIRVCGWNRYGGRGSNGQVSAVRRTCNRGMETMAFITARTRLFDQLARGSKPLGIFISSLDPAATEVAADAGFDFVMLDGEHGRIGRIEAEHHVRAAEASGIIPLVRILENSPALIQAMLDGGAQGVLVPHVDTAADAEQAAAASRYQPDGQRGMCPACHAGGYTLNRWADRVRAANANVLVIPIIESRRAVENVEAILGVQGIEIVMFGPGDLSADMGIDIVRDTGAMEGAWRRTLAAARAAGKKVMAPIGFGYDEADLLIAEMDLLVLHRAACAIVAKHRAHETAPAGAQAA
jgi:4-hydroxy-2-oxoheptanedioate aldolase